MKATSAIFHRRGIAVLGFAVSFVLLGMAATHLRWDDLRRSLTAARLFPWVLVSVASYLIGHLLRGLRCRLLARATTMLTPLGAANVVVVGYAVNNLLPARLGELARSGMLMERTGMPFSESLMITFVERVFDGLVILLLLLISTAFIPESTLLRSVGSVGVVVFGIAALGIALAVIAPELITGLVARLSARSSPKVHSLLMRIAISGTRAVSFLRTPTSGLAIFALSIAVWLFEAGMFLALLPAFSLPTRGAWAMAAMAVTNLGVLLPSSPGFVGPFHYFCMKTLMSVGVAQPVAASYAIIVHLCFFIPVTIWGVLAMMRYGVELGAALSLSRAAKRLPSVLERAQVPVNLVASLGNIRRAPELEHADPFFRALCEALVPGEALAAVGSERERVLESVAEFVRGQVDALPSRLHMLFGVGTLGFRMLVRARHWRSFCALPVERRRIIVEWWAYGPIGLTRQLFRLPRSTALLAFYEHPAIAAQWQRTPQSTTRLPISREP